VKRLEALGFGRLLYELILELVKSQSSIFASLRRDKVWVAKAREAAFELVDGDGGLGRYPDLVEELDLLLPEGEDEAAATEFLFKS
jgi:hypothetical protein